MNSEKDLKDIFFLFSGRNQFYALFSHTGTFPLGSRRSLSTYCVYIYVICRLGGPYGGKILTEVLKMLPEAVGRRYKCPD